MLPSILALALLGSPLPTTGNPRCPVTGIDVRNHRLHHYVTIQGRPWYVADHAAAVRLRACPGCYLPASALSPRSPAEPQGR